MRTTDKVADEGRGRDDDSDIIGNDSEGDEDQSGLNLSVVSDINTEAFEEDDDEEEEEEEEGDDNSQRRGRRRSNGTDNKKNLPALRKRSSRVSRPPARTGDYEDYDTSFDGEQFDDSDMDGASLAAQKFFADRLTAFLLEHQSGDCSEVMSVACDPSQWRVQILNQRRGLSAGFVNVIYHRLTPPRKFKSRVEVGMELGLFEFVRFTKQMPRSLQYLLAVETRERHLVSQCITAYDNADIIEEFFIDPDPPYLVHARPCPVQSEPKVFNVHCFPMVPNAKIRSDDERDAEREARVTNNAGPTEEERSSLECIRNFAASYGYAYGNTCIVNFGEIVSTGHFHNRDFLYPLGLKFVRQEHDTLTDRIVDCVCEIDCIQQSNPMVHPLKDKSFQDLDAKTMAELRPLFRITVAWDVGYNKHKVKVYEGKTPQLVWQSVLLERLGETLEECQETDTDALEKEMTAALSVTQSDDDVGVVNSTMLPLALEAMDEEERDLRAEVVELRRLHMRALSAGQEKGEMQPVKPRLALAHVDQFYDVGILPLLEGMVGTEDCVGYQYIDSRNKELPKTVLMKNLSNMQSKVRGLDKVASQFATERVSALLNIRKAQKKEAAELSKQQKKDEKKRKTVRSQQMVERRNRARELEKVTRTMRDDAVRALASRRQDVKIRVEQLVKEEEALPEFNVAVTELIRAQQAQDELEDAKQREKERMEEEEKKEEEPVLEEPDKDVETEDDEDGETDDKTIPRFANVPTDESSSVHIPFGTPISLQADSFGKAMELWQFLVTHASVLGLIAVPTEKRFEYALSICDREMCHLQDIMNRAQSQVLGPPCYPAKDNDCELNLSTDHARVKTRQEAKALFTKLALTLCKPLMPEYHRLMLVEASEAYLGGLQFELNELTWKEVARVVLTSTLCRHSGMNDTEVMSSYRGRGHLTAPDLSDRRVLRLAKRRVWEKYSQHLYRNQPDIAAVITPQNRNSMNHSLYHQHMLMNNYIGLGADFSSGLILRLTSPAVFEDDDLNIHQLALPRSEDNWEEGDVSRDKFPEHQCQLVSFWCQIYAHLTLFTEDSPFACTWMALELTLRLLEITIHHGWHNNLHFCIWKVLQLCRAPGARNCGKIFATVVYRVLRLTLYRLLETATVGVGEKLELIVQKILDNVNINPCQVSTSSTSGNNSLSTVTDVPSKKQKVYNMLSPLEVYRRRTRMTENVSAPIKGFVAAVTEVDEDQQSENNDQGDVMVESENTSDSKHEDELMIDETAHDEAALLLSVASQRLYRVLKHLMYLSHAATFNMPVDGNEVKGYYSFIRNPVCLSDILAHLLAGGYEGNLRAFYNDVTLVFQNALAFNEESTAIAQAALKLQCVFDRLMYECVLTLEDPLENLENCHVCDSSYAGDDGSTVICDRCDGPYHLECLCPPLISLPRGEWFCPNCVAARGLELVHPLQRAIVHDPLDNTRKTYFGRVVGIVPRESWKPSAKTLASTSTDGKVAIDEITRDYEDYLEYHVEFGFDSSDLNILTEKKNKGTRRQKGAGDVNDSTQVDVMGRGHQKTAVWRLADVLQYRYHSDVNGRRQMHELPSGYSFDTYDQLACVTACYEGWGVRHTALPPCIEPAHSKSMMELECDVENTRDPSGRMQMVLRGAAVLGPLTSTLDFRSDDWISLLLALAYKASSIDNRFNEKGLATEKAIEGRYMELVRNLKDENSYPSLSEFQQSTGAVKIGSQLLIEGEEEYLSDVDDDENSSENSSEDDSDEVDEEDDSEEEEEEEEGEVSNDESLDSDESAEELEFDEEVISVANGKDQNDSDDVDSAANNLEVKNMVDTIEDSKGSTSDDGNDFKADFEEEEDDDDDLWDEDMEAAAKSQQLLNADGVYEKVKPKPPPEILTMFTWENERRCRRKGTEDALMSISVVLDLSKKLIEDDIRHQDAEDLSESQLVPGGLLYPVMRQCFPRPAALEDVDLHLWLPAYERRILSEMKRNLGVEMTPETYDLKSRSDAAHTQRNGSSSPLAIETTVEVAEVKGDLMIRRVDIDDTAEFCTFCGQAESYTCSQFVYGHTWTEWYDWKKRRDARSRARQEAIDHEAALELDRILSGEAATSSKTSRAPPTVVQVWLPVNEADAAIVLEEARHSTRNAFCNERNEGSTDSTDKALHCANANGKPEDRQPPSEKVILYPPPNVEIEVLKGSVVAHEICADIMNATRLHRYNAKLDAYQKAYRAQRRQMLHSQQKQNSAVKKRLEAALQLAITRKESQYPEERMLADVLVGLGQGKVVSLGYDFSGNVYYAMSGSNGLLVCSRVRPDYSPCDIPACEDEAPFSMVPRPNPLGVKHDNIEGSTFMNLEKDCVVQWQKFDNRTDIATITSQLSPDEIPERSLRAALEILYLRKYDSDNDDEEEEEENWSTLPSFSDLLAKNSDYLMLLAGDCSALKEDGTPSVHTSVTEVESEEVLRELGKRKNREGESEETRNQKRKLFSLAGDWHKSVLSGTGKSCFGIGARVLCDGYDCLGNPLLWDAKILAIRSKSKCKGNKAEECTEAVPRPLQNMYKVRYIGWGSEYDAWVLETDIRPATAPGRAKQNLLRDKASTYAYSLPDSIDRNTSSPVEPWVPQILTTLCAHSYITAPGRHNHKESRRGGDLSASFNHLRNTIVPRLCESRRSPGEAGADDDDDEYISSTLSQRVIDTGKVSEAVTDELSTLKLAMLLVQAALPLGAMDDAEDRWGRGICPVPYYESMTVSDSNSSGGNASQGPSFYNAWRHAVMNASNAAQLMECQLMLEYGIRTAWLKTIGTKLLTCLPSRSLAIRMPTLGLVAVRLWALDSAVRYDKVKKSEGGGCVEDEKELRKEKESKLRAKQASKKKILQKDESNRKRAQYRR